MLFVVSLAILCTRTTISDSRIVVIYHVRPIEVAVHREVNTTFSRVVLPTAIVLKTENSWDAVRRGQNVSRCRILEDRHKKSFGMVMHV